MLLLSGNFSADAIPQIAHYALRVTTFGPPEIRPPSFCQRASKYASS